MAAIAAFVLLPTVLLEQLAAFDMAPRLTASLAGLAGTVVFAFIAWGIQDLAVDTKPVALMAIAHAITFFMSLFAALFGIGWLGTAMLYFMPLTAAVAWSGIGYLCLVNDSRIGAIGTVMGYLAFGVALLAIVGLFVLVMGGGGVGLKVYNVIRDVGRAAGGVVLGITLLSATD